MRCGGAPRGFKINCEMASSLRSGADGASGANREYAVVGVARSVFAVFARVRYIQGNNRKLQ